MNMHDPEEEDFGFGRSRSTVKDRIRDIKPSIPSASSIDLQALDRAAETMGFVSREALPESSYYPQRGRPRGPESFEALNMRVPATQAALFRRWCQDNRYSYPAGLAEIMRRAGITAG